MKIRITIILSILLAASFAMPAAQAATAHGAAPAKNVCSHIVPAKYLTANLGARAARPSPAQLAAIARYQALHSLGAKARSQRAAWAARDAWKLAMLAAHAGRNAAPKCLVTPLRATAVPQYTSGSGYAYISWMYQYGQDTGYFCGPAVVSEMSATVPGDMGTNPNTGTDVGPMVNELNNIVGVPDFGWAWYAYVPMDWNPTDSQRATFLTDLQIDVNNNTPVAGDAVEVAGGPHLVGHPVWENIGHYFEIGGWNTNTSQVWYADSATTVWSGVPPYSWFDTYTLETILGGRGYIW